MSNIPAAFLPLLDRMKEAMGENSIYLSFTPSKSGEDLYVHLYQQKALSLIGSSKTPYIEFNIFDPSIAPCSISANHGLFGQQELLRTYMDLSFQETSFIHAFLAIAKILRSSVPVEKFGCCNDFMRCSDAKACIHPGDYFHLGCRYRQNLEQGRIFYGRNRNID